MSSTQFAFLAQPPAQQKRRIIPAPLPVPQCSPPPVPCHRRVNSNIAAWAAHVQPGSPAPVSPHRRPSISGTSISSRRPSLTRRRPSIGHGRAPSGSFIHLVHTPTKTQTTPSVADFDLTALGYTSVFVQFDKTPTTPSPYLRTQNAATPAGTGKPPTPLTASVFGQIPIPPMPQAGAAPAKRVGMKRFRSLGILRPKKAKQAEPSSPTAKSTKSSGPAPKPKADPSTIAIRKAAKYTHVRPPPSLANELALMQFADGGSLESHAKRVMEGQAKAAAEYASGAETGVGVGVVHQDGKGGMWWDADEEMEYAHLLGDAEEGDEMDWEEFDDTTAPTSASAPNPAVDLLRRGSTSTNQTASPTTLACNPTYLLPLPENAATSTWTSIPNDRSLSSTKITTGLDEVVKGPGMSVLAVPARARRRVAHLQVGLAASTRYIVDADAFMCIPKTPRTPKSPRMPKSPLSPRLPKSPRSPSGFSTTGLGATSAPTPKKVARRRPAPLKLASSAHARANAKVALVGLRRASSSSKAPSHAAVSTPALVATPVLAPAVRPQPTAPTSLAREEFLETSFVPQPRPAQPRQMPLSPAPPAAHRLGFVAVDVPPVPSTKATSRLRGLFGRKGN